MFSKRGSKRRSFDENPGVFTEMFRELVWVLPEDTKGKFDQVRKSTKIRMQGCCEKLQYPLEVVVRCFLLFCCHVSLSGFILFKSMFYFPGFSCRFLLFFSALFFSQFPMAFNQKPKASPQNLRGRILSRWHFANPKASNHRNWEWFHGT